VTGWIVELLRHFLISECPSAKLNPNSEVEKASEQHLAAGARRSRRFTTRRVFGVRESKA
jgi:hypothetical protein